MAGEYATIVTHIKKKIKNQNIPFGARIEFPLKQQKAGICTFSLKKSFFKSFQETQKIYMFLRYK